MPRCVASPELHSLSQFASCNSWRSSELLHPITVSLLQGRMSSPSATPYHRFASCNFMRSPKLILPIIVSFLPRRVLNPMWHTLSRFCVMQLLAIIKIDTTYHCFRLATSRGKLKMACPITFLSYAPFRDPPMLHELSMFASCRVAWQNQIGKRHLRFALYIFLRLSKMTHPIPVSVLSRRVANTKWRTLSQLCVMQLWQAKSPVAFLLVGGRDVGIGGRLREYTLFLYWLFL